MRLATRGSLVVAARGHERGDGAIGRGDRRIVRTRLIRRGDDEHVVDDVAGEAERRSEHAHRHRRRVAVARARPRLQLTGIERRHQLVGDGAPLGVGGAAAEARDGGPQPGERARRAAVGLRHGVALVLQHRPGGGRRVDPHVGERTPAGGSRGRRFGVGG